MSWGDKPIQHAEFSSAKLHLQHRLTVDPKICNFNSKPMHLPCTPLYNSIHEANVSRISLRGAKHESRNFACPQMHRTCSKMQSNEIAAPNLMRKVRGIGQIVQKSLSYRDPFGTSHAAQGHHHRKCKHSSGSRSRARLRPQPSASTSTKTFKPKGPRSRKANSKLIMKTHKLMNQCFMMIRISYVGPFF